LKYIRKNTHKKARASYNFRASLITFQFHPLVVPVSDVVQERVFMWCILHIT